MGDVMSEDVGGSGWGWILCVWCVGGGGGGGRRCGIGVATVGGKVREGWSEVG